MYFEATDLKEIVVKVRSITPVENGKSSILFYPDKPNLEIPETQPAVPEPGWRSEPIEPSRAVSEPGWQFPGLMDSVIFPGLIYNLFQWTAIYEDKTKKLNHTASRLLYYLENQAGGIPPESRGIPPESGGIPPKIALADDVRENCWEEKGTNDALRSGLSEVNKAVASLGISRTFDVDDGYVILM